MADWPESVDPTGSAKIAASVEDPVHPGSFSMPLKTCDWRRFWHPRELRPHLGGDGFLYDPESEYGRAINRHLVALQTMREMPCLILLGEPGIGKSTAVKGLASPEATGCEACVVDLLRDCGSDHLLYRNLFEAPWFKEWESGDRQLELFLDSLDECRIRFPTVTALLGREFGLRPRERLRLRIVCRTAEWPEDFGQRLEKLWGKEGCRIYELSPLRRQDIAEAAAVHGVNAEQLIQEVIEREVQPFASRPITLELLINIFKRETHLPTRLAEIYERGLPLLCEETPGRREVNLHCHLSGKQQVAIASRIAALLVLSNGLAVRTGPDSGNVQPDEVLVSDLVGYAESVDGVDVLVDEKAVCDVVASGLFTFAGPERRAFAHQTYLEFLVARYLHHSGLNKKQIYSLITVPDEPALTIAPQLEEIAAWLASMNPEVLRDLLSSQPDVLVRGDIATTAEEVRARIVDALLVRVQQRTILDWLYLYRHFRKLRHLGISEQLRAWLTSPDAGDEARQAAIDIAGVCLCSDLSEECAALALNQAQSYRPRIAAAYVTAKVGTPEARKRLKALARGEAGNDPHDELRGYGLSAVWPDHMSAGELFACLARAQDDHFYGGYRSFLRSPELVAGLAPDDFAPALEWLLDQEICHSATDDLRDIAHNIMVAAWAHCDRPAVRMAFVRILLDRLRRHDHELAFCSESESAAFRERIHAERQTRRLVVETVVSEAGPSDRLRGLVWCTPPFVYPEDFEWVVQKGEEARPGEAERWLDIARFLFQPVDKAHFAIAYDATRRSERLADAFAAFFAPVDLGSPLAAELKAQYEEQQKWKTESEPKLLHPPPEQRVREAVARCLSAQASEWWNLVLQLTLDAGSTHYSWCLDVQGSPGWRNADASTRDQIVSAARQCLEECGPDESWIGTNSINAAQFGSLVAFRLLHELDPEWLESRDAGFWKRWAPSILAYPVHDNEGKASDVHCKLIVLAYPRAPEQILHTLDRLITVENNSHSHVFVLETMEGCWDGRISDAVVRRAEKLDLKPRCFGNLLQALFEHGDSRASILAASLLTNPPPATDPGRELAVEAAAQLLAHDAEAGWGRFWDIVGGDAEWGQRVLERLCEERVTGRFLQQLDAPKIGRVLEWLLMRLPPDSDPGQSGGFLSTEDMVRHWRDTLIYQLRDSGTPAAVAEIQRLRATHRELPWLEYVALRAGKSRQARAWQPATPRQIIELAQDANRRFVAGPSQLMDVLCESLERMEEKLHGETPRARLLWDTTVRRPKDEEDLSEYVKGYLEDDLKLRHIIVGREVKIRRRNWAGGEAGQLVDVHVDAVTDPRQGSCDALQLIIEVKGCWHPEVRTAMESQLVGRYLNENECQHGLFVVGWFLCDYWGGTDNRRSQARCNFRSIEECREFLDAQAATLSERLAPGGGQVRALVLDWTLR
jgi:hypothetical protein